MSDIKKRIIEILKDQKEIYGDELLTTELPKRKTSVIKNVYPENPEVKKSFVSEELPLISVDWEKATSLKELDSLINKCKRRSEERRVGKECRFLMTRCSVPA